MQGNIKKPQTISGNISAAGTISGDFSPKDKVSGLVYKDYGEKLEGLSTETTTTTVNHVNHTVSVDVNTRKIATNESVNSKLATKQDTLIPGENIIITNNVISAKGQTGPQGPKGDTGATGKDGKDGLPGKDGKDGINGLDGAKGDKGDPGEPGKDGADGAPGKDGKDGIDAAASKVYQLASESELISITDMKQGDIAVITTPIADGKNSISTYVYDETEKWIAADGSYSAENVYFKDDLTMTFDFGKYKANGKSVKIPAANKNVKGLLLDAFAEEKEPVITNPYIAVSLNDTADSVEIGTNFSKSLTATATYYDGKYSYGYVGAKNGDAASNNILSNYSISNNKTADTSTSNKLTTTFTVNKIDKTNSITFTGNASYGASNRIPVTNIENPREDKKILAGTTPSKTATFNVSVFRYSFKYVGTNLDPIDNNWMRTIADKTTANLKSVSLNIPAGTKRVVVALPGTHTLQKVIDVKGMGLDVKGTFDTRTLNIEGANSYTAVPYTIFVKENVNGLAATTYNFTIS